MALIELKDIKIEYQEFIPDKENYETIIFMHGRGGNLLSWFQQIPFFVKEYKSRPSSIKSSISSIF